MKLLPTGRKSAFYISMYTSLVSVLHFASIFTAFFKTLKFKNLMVFCYTSDSKGIGPSKHAISKDVKAFGFCYNFVCFLYFQLGAGSFLVHYVAVFVNSILINFGFSQEMQNPVSS